MKKEKNKENINSNLYVFHHFSYEKSLKDTRDNFKKAITLLEKYFEFLFPLVFNNSLNSYNKSAAEDLADVTHMLNFAQSFFIWNEEALAEFQEINEESKKFFDAFMILIPHLKERYLEKKQDEKKNTFN